MEINNFTDFNLNEPLLRAVSDMGFETPTPIQIKAIPLALQGRDVCGQAQTGTGKTAAFGLPLLNRVKPGQGMQSLILCPTRELAVQVAQELTRLARQLPTRVIPVYGGQSIEHQIRLLRKEPEVIVGTPGRVLDHLRRRTIVLNQIAFLILDEADEMLDMGFVDDIRSVVAQCPPERQTMLFSATLPPPVMALAREFLRQPERISIEGEETTVPLTEQRYYEVNPQLKVETLCRILDVENPAAGIVFCRTKQGTADLARTLLERGYMAEALHGDLSQRERDSAMGRFRMGTSELLVATDVAARGLDINNVTHVINFDIPQDAATYVHRIGRTGRAGKTGTAITLVTSREIKQLRFIERTIRKRITRESIPTFTEALEVRKQALTEKITATLQEGAGEYKDIASQLLEDYDSTEVLAAALKLVDGNGREMETAELFPARPERVRITLPFGRTHGLHPRLLVSELTSRTPLAARDIGDFEIHGTTTYLDIPANAADQVYAAFRNWRGIKPHGDRSYRTRQSYRGKDRRSKYRDR